MRWLRFSLVGMLVLMSLGTVVAWGAQAQSADEDIDGGLAVRQLAVGYDHACLLVSDATVRCWGHGDEGQLGQGDTIGSRVLVTVPGLTGVTALAAGGSHTCARLGDGTTRCWGGNAHGQLGDGKSMDRPLPAVVPGLSAARAVAAGYEHTCAALEDGTVSCWGCNDHGQLGSPTEGDSPVPLPIADLSGVVDLRAGPYSTCALLSDDSVACWGDVPGEPADEAVCTTGEDGAVRCTSRLPAGEAPRWLPETVPDLEGVADLALGNAHACALLHDGAIRCWGANDEGQLGDGTTDESAVPVSVVDLAGIRDLAAGWYHTCAVLGEGAVRCWGTNDEGQLGDGTTDDSCPSWSCPLEPWDPTRPGQRAVESEAWCDRCASPIAVVGLDEVVELATGSDRTCALRADGTIACWGYKAAQFPGDCPQDDCRLAIEIRLGPEPGPGGAGAVETSVSASPSPEASTVPPEEAGMSTSTGAPATPSEVFAAHIEGLEEDLLSHVQAFDAALEEQNALLLETVLMQIRASQTVELGWLDSHPPESCYQETHAAWREAVDVHLGAALMIERAFRDGTEAAVKLAWTEWLRAIDLSVAAGERDPVADCVKP